MASTVVKAEASDIRSLHQVCRLCLSKESLADLFKENSFHQWISDFLSITISIEDRLSKAVCAMCRQRLTEFHHFRERSQEVQGVLRSMVQDESVEVEEVMPKNKGIEKSNENSCTRCGKLFLKRQHLDNHMKIHTNQINDFSNNNSAVTELRKIKSEPFEECDMETETHGPSSTIGPQTSTKRTNHENPDQNAQITVVLPYSAVRGHEGLFIGEVECEPSMIDIEDVKVEPSTGDDGELRNRLSEKASCVAGANTVEGVLPVKRTEATGNVELFQCNKCHKTVQSGRALWSHYRTVHGPKNHMCRICEIAFPFLKDLKKHEVTNKHLINLKEIQKNRKLCASKNRKVRENAPDVCAELNQHETENNNYGNSSPKLTSKLKRKRQVEDQQPSIHQKNKECLTEATDADYRPHTSIDQSLQSSVGGGDDQLRCDICHEVFPNEKKLMLHKKYHGSKRHECSVCGRTFLNRFVLQEHMSSHGSGKPKPKSVKPVLVVQGSNAGKPYKCQICQKVFKLQSSLRNHRNEKHGPRRHDCHVCGSMYATGFDLQWHMKIHCNSDGDGTEDAKELKFTP